MNIPPSGQNWRQLAAVQVGGSLCLPVLMVGQTLSQTYGIFSAWIAIALGNLMLFLLALFTSYAGASQKKSTAELAAAIFGKYGRSYFALALVISMIGWFAIQLKLMGLCLNIPFSSILLGLCIGVGGLKGLQGVTLLANIFTPLLAMTILYALMSQGQSPPLIISSDFTSLAFSGLALVIAGSIAAVMDLPTFFREAKSKKDGWIAAFLLFCVALPLIEATGAYLSFLHPEHNLVDIFQQLSGNPLWQGWISLFLILAGWATNNANMYSASVSLEQIVPTIGLKGRICLTCGLGTALSCFPLLDHLEIFIGAIGILLSSMGAVMVGHIMFKERGDNPTLSLINLSIWAIGTAVGFLTMTHQLTLTTLPLLDAFTFAMLLKMVFKILNFSYAQRRRLG